MIFIYAETLQDAFESGPFASGGKASGRLPETKAGHGVPTVRTVLILRPGGRPEILLSPAKA